MIMPPAPPPAPGSEPAPGAPAAPTAPAAPPATPRRSAAPVVGAVAGGALVLLVIGAAIAVVAVVALAAFVVWGGSEDGQGSGVLVQSRFDATAAPFPVGDVGGYHLGVADGRYEIATRTADPPGTGRALGALGATTTRLRVTAVVAGRSGDAAVGVACVRTDTAGAAEDGFAVVVHGDLLMVERIGFAPATLAATRVAGVRPGSRLSLTCTPEGGEDGGAVRVEAELDGTSLAGRTETGYAVGFDAMALDLRGRRAGDAATFGEARAIGLGP